jgi:hypothetical protein
MRTSSMRPSQKPTGDERYAPTRHAFALPMSPVNVLLATSTPSTKKRAVVPFHVAVTCCHVPGTGDWPESR